jgi:hypothetical protein
MNRPDNSRRDFLAKSVYSAAILAASPLRKAFVEKLLRIADK